MAWVLIAREDLYKKYEYDRIKGNNMSSHHSVIRDPAQLKRVQTMHRHKVDRSSAHNEEILRERIRESCDVVIDFACRSVPSTRGAGFENSGCLGRKSSRSMFLVIKRVKARSRQKSIGLSVTVVIWRAFTVYLQNAWLKQVVNVQDWAIRIQWDGKKHSIGKVYMQCCPLPLPQILAHLPNVGDLMTSSGYIPPRAFDKTSSSPETLAAHLKVTRVQLSHSWKFRSGTTTVSLISARWWHDSKKLPHMEGDCV